MPATPEVPLEAVLFEADLDEDPTYLIGRKGGSENDKVCIWNVKASTLSPPRSRASIAAHMGMTQWQAFSGTAEEEQAILAKLPHPAG